MKSIILTLIVLMPSLSMAQDWLPMLRKVFECAPAWDYNGGYSREEAFSFDGTFCTTGGYSGENGYFRIGKDVDMSMHIYYNSEIDYLPGTMFYVGQALACWRPSLEGKCYSASGKLLYEGLFDVTDDMWYYPPHNQYPTPYSSNKRFEAIWDGPNMYLGETVNGVKHGLGLYIWANGDCLFGEWKNGKKCGYGMRKFSNTCSCIWQEDWPSVNYLPQPDE